jgi:hypothetical protein
MEMKLHYLGAAGKTPLNIDLDSYINNLPIKEISKYTKRLSEDDSGYSLELRLRSLKQRLDEYRDKDGKIPSNFTHADLQEAIK